MDKTDARKSPEAAELPPQRPEGLHTIFDDADKAWRDYFARKYGEFLGPMQTQKLEQTEVSVESSLQFDKRYRSETGQAAEAGVTGYYTEASGAHVLREGNTAAVETMGHELLHSAQPAEARYVLPPEIVEGYVERRAQQAMGHERITDQGDQVAYAEGQRTVESADRVCGPEAMDKAVLQGDDSSLRECLDRSVEQWRAAD